MIRTGEYGYLLANGDKSFCFPVIQYLPRGTYREQRWAKSHGMAPLGIYRALAVSPQMTMYVRTLSWFDRNKMFVDAWLVEHSYTKETESFTFYMRVDGVSRP